MIAILRSRCARIWRPCARLLGLLALWGVLAPASGWAQLAPEYFSIDPAEVELGECYTIDVGTPDITLDVEYSLDGGSNIILYGWPSIGSDGTAEICTSLSTATGAYIFVRARNALGGDWVSGGDSLTVTAPPPPDFRITASPGSRSVEPGERAAYSVSVTAVNGFSAAVGLSASGVPSGVTARFSPASLTSPYTASSTLTLTASAGASVGTTTVTVTGAGGGLSRTASVDLDVELPQPTSFRINSTGGYAGVDTMVVTVGNGANMSLDLRYTLNGAARTGTFQLDASGRWSQALAHNLPTGTYAYTGMKNALASDWVSISATYRVRPPQPTSMSVSPSSITTPDDYTFDVGNGAGMTLDVQYTRRPPGGTTGAVQTINNWPTLVSAGGGRPDDGTADISASGCTLPGVYRFTAARNARNSAWVSVTTAAPSRIDIGTSATVTLTGRHLCDLEFTTGHAGVSFSNVAFDPVAGAGTSASVRVTVASTAPAGVATVTVHAGDGTASFDVTIPPDDVIQPTTFSIDTPTNPTAPLEGYAGVDTMVVTVGNGARMSLDLRYTLNGAQTGTIQLDASGRWSQDLAHNLPTGTYVYTEMKNTLASTWVDIPDVSYTVHPPQPTSMSVSPGSINTGESYRFNVGNGAGVTLDVQYTLTPPGGAIGPVQTLESWPSLVSAGGTRPDDGTVSILASGCTLPGVYRFTAARNTRNSPWVTVTPGPLTLRAPVSVTSAAPSTIPAGTSATVTLTGENLCGLTLTTDYPGVSFSGLAFDPSTGAGTSATVVVTVASTAAAGATTVTVSAGEGTATFDLTIGPRPDFRITASPVSHSVGPTGSADYRVSVTPLNGFSAAVGLSVSSMLPSGVTASFSPISLSAPDSASTLTLTTAGAGLGTTAVTVTGGGGGLSRIVAVDLQVVDVPQPTMFSIDTPTNPTAPLEGYAGVNTMVVTVGNGANMSLDLRYTLDNGAARTGNIQLDADGGWSQDLAHNLSTGTYVYTEMKNTLVSTWVDISPDVTYTVHPPQPTSMSVSQSEFDTTTPLIYTMDVGNGAGVTLDVQYTRTPPGGAEGPVQTLESWPSLVSAGGTRPDDGTANIFASGCTLPGVYQFKKAKNTLNMDSDPATDLAADANWVTVTPGPLTLSALVSVTSAAPSSILAGTNATVTLTGAHLCDLMFETDYVGVRFSNPVFDPPSGAGRTATVLVMVESTAAAGVATVTVRAGEGTATFDLTIVGGTVIHPTTFSISTPADPDAPLEGFAGVDTVVATVGQGANMSLDLRYTLNGRPLTGNIQLDADAQWSQVLPQNIWTGIFVYTEMKNALASELDWVDIPDVTYKVRPPQPISMTVSPLVITTPASYTIDVENGARVRLDVQYTLMPPGGAVGPAQTLQGWPSLVSAGGASPDDGTVDIFASGCTLPGVYQFTAAKNTLNMDSDPATDLASDTTWVPVTPDTLTLSAPVAVTAAEPSTIPVGTSATVTLRGAHLCALALSTTYAGVTLSDVVFDPVPGEGAMATVRVTVAATAAEGMAPVTVQAGEGTATFNLTIGPVVAVPGVSPLRREYIYLGGRVIAVESP